MRTGYVIMYFVCVWLLANALLLRMTKEINDTKNNATDLSFLRMVLTKVDLMEVCLCLSFVSFTKELSFQIVVSSNVDFRFAFLFLKVSISIVQ